MDNLFGGYQQLAKQLKECDRTPENVEVAISYFQKLDPDSVSLRYPLRNDGSPLQVTLTKETFNIVRSHLEEIATFFNEQYVVLKEKS